MSDAKSVDRTIRVVTHQDIIKGEPLPPEGFPVRSWSIEIFLVDEQGQMVPATIFDKVTYHLHPTFVNPTRVLKKPPFKIEEKGWGEFELGLTLTFIDKCGDRKLAHDLNFHETRYEVDHVIHVPINKSEKMRALLSETGSVPSGDAIGDKRKSGASGADSGKNKRSKLNTSSMASAIKGSVDLEKLAEGLTKLNEDDLLGVVQMVTDNRTPEMNIKNDVEEGEFTMDLYTLPDSLLKSLWDYIKKRTE